ncbi:MAG: membrane protein insertase YidC [Imperialibacter sp.]
MDRQQVIGMVMMLILLTVYFTFFAPDPPVEEPIVATTESVVQPSQASRDTTTTAFTPLADSIKDGQLKEKFGAFAAIASGKNNEVALENDDIKVSISTKGGFVSSVELKNYKTYDGKPLILLDEQSSKMNLSFGGQNRNLKLDDFYFKPSVTSKKVSGKDSVTVTLRASLSTGQYIEQAYTIYGKGYEIGYSLTTKGLDNYLSQEPVVLQWKNDVKRVESDLKDSRIRTTINYYTTAGETDELSATSEDLEEETISESIQWVAIKQKFFTAAIIANDGFSGAYVATKYAVADTTKVKEAMVSLTLPAERWKTSGLVGKLFFGPNEYNTLKDVAPEFSSNINLGWSILGWINKGFTIPVFHFLEGFMTNYGIIIIIIVILMRMILFPLNYKSYMSMAKMKVLKPEIDEIKAQYPDDMQKQQSETMALYQKVGINPLSGCIPMLLQMPILFAMFYFFPNAIELRQVSFLWAHDLSTYDSVLNLPFVIPFYGDHVSLFTLLMTASTILYTWSNSQMTTVQGPMKTLQYIMPITFLFFLNSYAAGLTYYYFVSNILSFGQQMLIRRFVDEDKIKLKLEENKKKNANKKKSSFQQRLDEAMKAGNASRKKK